MLAPRSMELSAITGSIAPSASPNRVAGPNAATAIERRRNSSLPPGMFGRRGFTTFTLDGTERGKCPPRQRAARANTFRWLMRHPCSSRRSTSSYMAVPLVPSAMTASPFERARTPSPSWPVTMMLVT